MSIRRIYVILSSVVLMASCNRGLSTISPIGPSTISGSTPIANWQDRIPWSPYIVIHNPAEALPGYQQAVGELMAHGAIRGARVGISENEVMNNRPNVINQWLASQGVELLVILDNYLLFHDNLEEIMDRVIAMHPGVTTFQIGNETTTILPKTGPTISIEQYMKAFHRIYGYVSVKYPNIILVSQSTVGSGTYGSNELEQMILLGLSSMSPRRVVIGMNVYNEVTIGANASVLNSQLRNYRVWVTETGSPIPDEQISHVMNVYPVLSNQLRAERIYWYALWVGDSGTEAGFGLIRHAETPPILREPLFEVLVGKR